VCVACGLNSKTRRPPNSAVIDGGVAPSTAAVDRIGCPGRRRRRLPRRWRSRTDRPRKRRRRGSRRSAGGCLRSGATVLGVRPQTTRLPFSLPPLLRMRAAVRAAHRGAVAAVHDRRRRGAAPTAQSCHADVRVLRALRRMCAAGCTALA
jgi:hypothetical protein